MSRIASVVIAVVAIGCGAAEAPAEARAWAPLVAAVDLDPDPNVVEVELTAEVATVEFVEGIVTEVWAYRDSGSADAVASVPGPLIETALGDRLVVHLRNALPEGTTLHWHGLRVPEAMDGNPMNGGAVAAGESTTVEFVVRDQGLHWYHSHLYADEQIQRGLQGTLVVRGREEPQADLERVLVLDDVELGGDGALALEPSAEDLMLGRRGNTLLVNGRVPATAAARPGTIERWRLVNTSNGRHFALELSDTPFLVVGWDNGLVAEPYTTQTLVIAPGERYDVLVAIEGGAGERLLLETLEVARGGGMVDPGPYTLLELALEDPVADNGAVVVPPRRDVERLEVDADTMVRRFTLEHETAANGGTVFTINGKRWPLAPPVHVEVGTTEIWEIANDTDHDHPFHLHGFPFQVLDRDGVPEPTLGWKDTVRVAGQGLTRIAVRHDELGMWMFHCTIPEHAERGMMADLHVMEDPQ